MSDFPPSSSDPQPPADPFTRKAPLHPLERRPSPPAALPTTHPPGTPQTPRRRIRFDQSPVIATYIILAINILVFLADTALQFSTGANILTELGAKVNQLILQGEYWRFFTPMFLHAGILHIGFNGYFLYVIGPQVERSYGTWRFLAVYLIAGFAGSIASFALTSAPSVGASGALFGLIGALLPFFYRNRQVLSGTQRRITSIVQVIVINLLIGLSPGIDNWAHLGGLLGGLAAAWFMTPRYTLKPDDYFTEDLKVEDESNPAVVWTAALILFASLVMLAYWIILLRGGVV
jgi:rhomboid protease GluP